MRNKIHILTALIGLILLVLIFKIATIPLLVLVGAVMNGQPIAIFIFCGLSALFLSAIMTIIAPNITGPKKWIFIVVICAAFVGSLLLFWSGFSQEEKLEITCDYFFPCQD